MEYQLQQTGQEVQDILNQAPTTEENLQNEITRSTNKDNELETAIENEQTRADGVESGLQTAIDNEVSRAEGAEGNLQTAITNERNRAEGVEGGLRTDVDAIEEKIPTGASDQNKLATEGFVNSSISTNTADFKGTYNSIEELQTEVPTATANDYAFVISTDASGNTVYNRYKYVAGEGWQFEYALNNSSFTAAQWSAINSAITAALVAKLNGLPTAAELTQRLNAIIDSVATEKTRAEGIEAGLRTDVNTNAAAIVTEKNRAQGVEGTLQTSIVTEENRAKAAETLLQQNINAEAILRDNGDDALQAEIDEINSKIPTQASASNQLADKAFVNSSIATNTGDFKGTYNSLAELQAVTNVNANDYGFVIATDGTGNTVYNRYKYVTGQGWVFEYALNNSSFTAAQWGAINSGITAALAAKINGLPDIDALNAMFAAITSKIPANASSSNKLVDYAQLVAALAAKQDNLIFDNVPTENSNNPVKSGGVYSAIATVTAAVVGLQSSKQDVLTFDQYPTPGSNNPVRSTGIYSSIENAVAPKANQTDLDNAVIRISTNEVDIAQLQAAYRGLTQNDVVPVAPTDTWPVANPQKNVIYRVADRTNTPPQYYTDYMWNGTVMVRMAQYNNAIDPRPKKASQNLVTSGGVFDNMGALDVSELNATENPHTLAQYVDLSAALAAIPTDYQKGGMSIKFVCSSDNKYVQYRLLATAFSTTPSDWLEDSDKNIITSLVGSAVLNTRFWRLDYKVAKDVEYKFKYLSGDKGVITTDNETGPELVAGEWISFTPSAAENLYLRIPVGTTADVAPNILMMYGNSGIAKELVEHYNAMGNLSNVNKDLYGVPDSVSIAVTASTNSYSNNNIYNGSALPIGSVVKIKITEGDDLLSKIKLVVNNQYYTLLNYTDFVDGQTFEIPLSESVTSIGLYVEAAYVIGTGNVKLKLWTNYQETISYKSNNPQISEDVVLSDLLFDNGSNLTTQGQTTDVIKSAIKSVRVWGFSTDNIIGISFLSKTTISQLFFNIFDENGNSHGCYYNFSNSQINPSGLTYLAIYKENLRFYPAYEDDSILPSEIRIAVDFSAFDTTTIGNYDASICFAPFAPVVCFDYPNPYTLIQENGQQTIYITCRRTGVSGVDADFCGLNAIGDAANSITDASEHKKYVILIDGHFLFTDPKMVSAGGDFKYVETGEPTVLIAKDNVSFRGIGTDRAVIEVNLDDSLTETDFPYSDYFGRYLTWMDYQPMYITRNADIQNMTIIGRNCRYTVHIELNSEKGKDISLRNCVFIKKTRTKGSTSCLTMGEIPYFNMLVEHCTFINEMGQTLIGGHTPLEYISDGHENCNVRFRNCNFRTAGQITLSTYHYNRKDLHIFENCKFHPLVEIETSANASSKRPLDTLTDRKFTGAAMPYSVDAKSACGLRIRTITGASSSVRFDPTCSAFGIVGNKNDNTSYELSYSAIKTYGYEYKDDSEGSNAYACGWVNIDPTTGNSLGAILGDCSGTNKTLKVTINGTDYSIIFNTNMTSASNADVIAIINAVIGSVATCDTYNPEVQLYPDFDGEEYGVANAGNSVIEKGMGVVKVSANSVRKAKTSDGYIDGVAIDTFYPLQKGRIITKGMLYNRTNSGTAIYYSINPVLSPTDFGTKISIDENNDGKFKVSSAAPVLKYVGENKVEIL